MTFDFSELSKQIEGTIHTDKLHQNIYATDASVYKMTPLGVVFPKHIKDLQKIVQYAKQHKIGLIPRAAGTSLAGQCVGKGLVVDVSKHFTKIISIDKSEQTVTLQPGVIRDDLNRTLKPFDLFFGPNTSTANRCMMGGMVGNNSSGTTSIQYGVTRDYVEKLTCVLSDGSVTTFEAIDEKTFELKCKGNSLENKIYKTIDNLLSKKKNIESIENEFPHNEIHRRCTGYALDELIKFKRFGGNQEHINLAKLLCGSEGTLAFTSDITLSLSKLPPKEGLMICAHFNSLQESLIAVTTAMKHTLFACELMDKTILDCTKEIKAQQENRFFLNGAPQAVLMLELRSDNQQDLKQQADKLIKDLKENKLGYHFPIVSNNQIKQVNELRKAGLGALANIKGNKKAVACIEDTAVRLKDLPQYIADVTEVLEQHKQKSIYYAHAGAGEIHLRPILDLNDPNDVKDFVSITSKTADLVKKYNGAMSGEHGDGIVRSHFIKKVLGENNYKLISELKNTFDPNRIFNPGKIIESYPIAENFRDKSNGKPVKTFLDFSEAEGFEKAISKCNGSGDCRKSYDAGGVMCPSYRATKNEKETTRARANALRTFIQDSNKSNPFDQKELKEVLDLCLSCKACASECPSNVDMATFKSEFLHQYYKSNTRPIGDYFMKYYDELLWLGQKIAPLTNYINRQKRFKKLVGIASKRNLPQLSKRTWMQWYRQDFKEGSCKQTKKTVYVFCDEFTNYHDPELGKDSIQLLSKLGYKVILKKYKSSGRTLISKGFLKKAKKHANANIKYFASFINEHSPLIGVEPSAILSFKDEYLKLASDKKLAKKLAENCMSLEQFLANELQNNQIDTTLFTETAKQIKIHVHCHQKSIEQSKAVFDVLNIPKNFKPTLLQTGCCGMAGSFGYEPNKIDLSLQIGEESLFKKIMSCGENDIITATGFSCRHQILEGMNRNVKHPISILKEALNESV